MRKYYVHRANQTNCKLHTVVVQRIKNVSLFVSFLCLFVCLFVCLFKLTPFITMLRLHNGGQSLCLQVQIN